jgi:hypothetical protein
MNEFFFVSRPFFLLLCQIYVLHTTESKNFKKNSRKNSNLGIFYQMRADQFTVTGTGLPVIPTDNQFSSSMISKFKFVVVFDRFYWVSR